MRIQVDTEKCCGSGQCVFAVPEVFDQDDVQGFVVLLQECPPESFAPAVEAAVRSCPTEAISVVEG
ncbi:ferredoxin [Nocardia nova]|uniref:ferredoxin n=1 Tax=Nocardia nova TaxID=37330 RepID=UPI003799E00F